MACTWTDASSRVERLGDGLVADDLVDETVVTDDRLRGSR
jgi:hypothetical protein